MNTNLLAKPQFDTPENAVESLLAAYQARDLNAMVAAKDFALDSRIFLEDLTLPVSDEQRKKFVVAFEINFRKQMAEEGIPDYREMTYAFTGRKQLQENLVLVMLEGRWLNGRRLTLKLPAFKTESGWKAVRLPPHDHL